eukprot:3073676-Rhodomonas_salina.1
MSPRLSWWANPVVLSQITLNWVPRAVSTSAFPPSPSPTLETLTSSGPPLRASSDFVLDMKFL